MLPAQTFELLRYPEPVYIHEAGVVGLYLAGDEKANL